MPVLSNEAAVERLTKIVEVDFDPDELLEVYNELFEDDPYTAEEAHDDPSQIVEQLVIHINHDLDPEDLLYVWNLICPQDRQVWFDEDKNEFHFNEVDNRVAD